MLALDRLLSDAGTHSRHRPAINDINAGSTAETMLKDLKLAWPSDGKFRVSNASWERKLRRFNDFATNGSGKLGFSAIIKMFAERVELTYYLRGSASF